jgi:hypothetical protein
MASVYGNNGNRWWAGLNIGSDQSTILGTNSILSPVGYESLPSGDAADDKQFAAAAAKNKGSANPVTISVENVSWYNINGPYATQALANAAIPAIQKAHPAPGELSQLYDSDTGQPQSANSAALPSLANLESFLAALGSAHLWERVGEFAIGIVLIAVGLVKLTGSGTVVGNVARLTPQGKVASKIGLL